MLPQEIFFVLPPENSFALHIKTFFLYRRLFNFLLTRVSGVDPFF
ncbi:hypothetical protein PORCRE_1759 [Porphyromonas crevioricanis JCM 15906]|uniref:Uncharacterized protein n=1 Tax=Porphyromonas crevioricanis JCM 15906 TaxID=1305617 RepID=T1DTV6_9PORP|nr:hypothetical protein PORCRE_1759 [Porphyromonas crevioricanis JCM 15906]GAD07010.1 hypothetical protein PORCAN_623 [Porphyromonas crevioricanis JCM 13913]